MARLTPSNYLHAAIAAIITLTCALITGIAWPGALAAIALFAGREHAQADDRMCAELGKSVSWRALRVFTSWRWWDWDSVFDFVAPTVAALITAIVWYYWRAL